MIVNTRINLFVMILSLFAAVGFAEKLAVTNPGFELPEISYNLLIFDANDWSHVPGYDGGPYTSPTSQRAGESGIQKNAGITGNAAYGNSNCGNIYQLLNSRYCVGRTYQLSAYASNSWYAETAVAEFYYLPDSSNPLNRVPIVSDTVTLDDGSNTDYDYKLMEVEFAAEESQPYLGKMIGIQFSGSGAGDRNDPGRAWWNLDDITVEAYPLSNPYPADDAENVPVDVTLTWGEPNFMSVEYNVYLAPESDANLVPVSVLQTDNFYTSPVSLQYDTTYNWRVDIEDPNYAGKLWTFTTAPKVPIIVNQPVSIAAFEDDDISFDITVTNDLPLTYYWYYSVDDATDTTVDDTLVQSGDVNSLAITDVDDTNEGHYYCVADDGVCTPAVSETAELLIQRKLCHYELENTLSDTQGNYDLTLSGSSAFVTGPDNLGNAIELDGDDDYVYVDLSDVNCFAGSSVTCWVKAASLAQPEHSTVLHINPLFQIDLNSTGTHYCYYDSASTVLGEVSANEWLFIAAVREGSTTSIYYNGLLVDTVIDSRTDCVIDRIGIGVDRSLSVDSTFAGAVDDVQVYTYPLDKYQVYELYYAVVPVNACLDPIAADLSGPNSEPDCIVNLYDFVYFAQYWLADGLYPTP